MFWGKRPRESLALSGPVCRYIRGVIRQEIDYGGLEEQSAASRNVDYSRDLGLSE